MLFEPLALIFCAGVVFCYFGHLKDAGLAFIAGGFFITMFGAMVYADGIDVLSQKNETMNYSAPFTWGWNSTFNFSTFTPSNITRSTVYQFNETTKTSSFPKQIWLLFTVLGLGYMSLGAVTLMKGRE